MYLIYLIVQIGDTEFSKPECIFVKDEFEINPIADVGPRFKMRRPGKFLLTSSLGAALFTVLNKSAYDLRTVCNGVHIDFWNISDYAGVYCLCWNSSGIYYSADLTACTKVDTRTET